MTTRCSVFIATSLDGFISRTDGRIDWLNEAHSAIPPGEDYGYAQFMSTVDAIVMGRNTFEQVLSFAEWPYGSKPVTVISGVFAPCQFIYRPLSHCRQSIQTRW
jgi:dihydrofolate reductase